MASTFESVLAARLSRRRFLRGTARGAAAGLVMLNAGPQAWLRSAIAGPAAPGAGLPRSRAPERTG